MWMNAREGIWGLKVEDGMKGWEGEEDKRGKI